MPWNPDKYNEYQKVREKPFFDLISHLQHNPKMKVADLGCGTGNLTSILADKFEDADVTGIDSSETMLSKATFKNVRFERKTVEAQLNEATKWDLIISNATMQWIDDHNSFFPLMISRLNIGGQLAIQMPSQTENLLNKILFALVQEQPYADALKGWKRASPVLSIDEYATIMFEQGGSDIIINQKMYPIITQTSNDLYEFISGTALVPYFERLDGLEKENFICEFKHRIAIQFPKMPAIYAFKRMIIYAKF